MPCCKAEEFGHWCDDVEIVYTDDDGNDYCLFHAPAEHKGMNVEEFNSRVATYIQNETNNPKQWPKVTDPVSPWANCTCILSGTIFPGSINFTNLIKGTTLFPSISFSKAIFTDTVWFSAITFQGDVGFQATSFLSDAWFNKVTFQKNAVFKNAKFLHWADFQYSIFKGYAFFEKTVFYNTVHFLNTQFHNQSSFDFAQFTKAMFIYAIFKNDISFNYTKFKETCTLWHAQIEGSLHIKNAIFSGTSHIEIPERNCIAYFHKIHFENVLLYAVNFTRCNFILCEWTRSWGWRWLHNWMAKRGWERHKTWGRRILLNEKECDCYAEVEEEYRALKQKYKNEGNEAEASEWHYSEKEMFRRKHWWRRYNPVSLTNLYKIFSGYGECPGRAAFWLLLFIALPFVLIGWDFLSPLGLSWPPDANATEAIVEPATQYLLFAKPDYVANHGFVTTWLTVITRLLVPIQAALFGLALRNKFRR